MGVIDVDTSERHLDVPPRPDGLISIMYLTDFVIILLCIYWMCLSFFVAAIFLCRVAECNQVFFLVYFRCFFIKISFPKHQKRLRIFIPDYQFHRWRARHLIAIPIVPTCGLAKWMCIFRYSL